jgi:hypothetical protein
MSESFQAITLYVHAASTLAMTGLIWFVQVVHYPLMGRVGEQGYTAYQDAHMRRTTWVVGPLMLAEMSTAALLIFTLGPQAYPLTITGIVMLVLIWGSTAGLQVPAHNRMLDGFDASAHRRLVGTNWVRTLLWSARGVMACVLIATN